MDLVIKELNTFFHQVQEFGIQAYLSHDIYSLNFIANTFSRTRNLHHNLDSIPKQHNTLSAENSNVNHTLVRTSLIE